MYLPYVDLSRVPVYLLFRFDEISQHASTIVLVISALIGVRVGKAWLVSLESRMDSPRSHDGDCPQWNFLHVSGTELDVEYDLCHPPGPSKEGISGSIR